MKRPVEALQVFLAFDARRILVGRLAIKERQIWFEYDRHFLDLALPISPLQLPIKPGLQRCNDKIFDGLFGVFNDSLPDGFGRLLLDRHLRAQGIMPESLTPLDRLAYVGHQCMGALCYQPEHIAASFSNAHLELDQLAQEAHAVLEQDNDVYVEELLQLNGSSNGARPKVMVLLSPNKERILPLHAKAPKTYEPWIIKFPSHLDPKDIAQIEFAYSLMARAAGIDMPKTHLFPGQKKHYYFGIQRFDRVQDKRFHVHTLCGLLHSDHRIPALDYEDLLKATLYLTKDHQQVQKAFRLAAFNVLAHNRDDHGKNFSFLMNAEGQWQLAPAYDLTFSYGPGGEHSTTVMGEGKKPTLKHLRALAALFALPDAEGILAEVTATIKQWPKFAALAQLKQSATQQIQRHF